MPLTFPGPPAQLAGSTDRREVLADADFVILTFSERNAYYRGLDCEVSLKHGVRMCSGDTIGPGGIFRGLREVPRALAVARDVEALAPNAWVINFVNPTAVLGIALMRYAPDIRSFAICDGLHEPHYRLNYLKDLEIVGNDVKRIPPEVESRLVLQTMGVNHFTWLTQLHYNGRDLMPAWRDIIRQKAKKEATDIEAIRRDPVLMDDNARSKARYNYNYIVELMDIFGAYPDRIGHTKEYVPYFQGTGAADNVPEPISIFDAAFREKLMRDHREETRAYARGEKPMDAFFAAGRADHATDIIESMWGQIGRAFYINCANRGAVSNMAGDAYLESLCDVDMNGPRPRPMGDMPRGLLGLQQQVLDTHELTAQAAVTCDLDILLRAMMTDPIVNNCGDGRAIMDELLAKEKSSLPMQWYGLP